MTFPIVCGEGEETQEVSFEALSMRPTEVREKGPEEALIYTL